MIAHALTIVSHEMKEHVKDAYPSSSGQPVEVVLGTLAEGVTDDTKLRDKIVLSIVNIREEKALKNLPNYVRNEVTLKASYENPPVFLNFLVLATITHGDYKNALSVLSRVIRFFQFRNVFTQDSVLPASLTTNAPDNPLDQLETFKLIFDFYSPTLEEANHLWGTLGGKQYPCALYMLRMLDLKFRAVQSESGLITEVQSDFYHKKPVGN